MKGVGGINGRNKSCKFPFEFDGMTFKKCTTYGKHSKNTPWCSTKVHSNNSHVYGNFDWGFCEDECPGTFPYEVSKIIKSEIKKIQNLENPLHYEISKIVKSEIKKNLKNAYTKKSNEELKSLEKRVTELCTTVSNM